MACADLFRGSLDGGVPGVHLGERSVSTAADRLVEQFVSGSFRETMPQVEGAGRGIAARELQRQVRATHAHRGRGRLGGGEQRTPIARER